MCVVLTSQHTCLQMSDLETHCASHLVLNLNLATFLKTAVLAEQTKYEYMIDACIDFALRGEKQVDLSYHLAIIISACHLQCVFGNKVSSRNWLLINDSTSIMQIHI